MIPAEEEDPSPCEWVIEAADGTPWRVATAGPFANDEQAASDLHKRRKAYDGYTVKLLKDGQVWEPQG